MLKLDEFHIRTDVSDDLWDGYLNGSAQSTPFLTSAYLRAISLEESRGVLVWKNVPVLGFLDISRKSNLSETLPPRAFSLYQGIFFVAGIGDDYRRDLRRLDFVYALLTLLPPSNFIREFSLHHSISDIRGFQWFVHDNMPNVQLDINSRATGEIRLSNFDTFEGYLRSIRTTRFSEYKKSRANPKVRITLDADIEKFLYLYKKTFLKTDIKIENKTLARVSEIISSGIENNYGSLSFLEFLDGTPVSSIYILYGQKTHYYQFGASDPEHSKLFGSTRLLLESIENAYIEGKTSFDVAGMNSPKRGEFKASFNARSTSYFELELSSIS
jgi:hypothetical protein